MEDGDESALKNWRVWRELSIRKYEEEYDRLNVKFDHYTGESQVDQEWMDKAVERADGMGLISDVEGAKTIDLEQWKMGKAVIWKKDELTPSAPIVPFSHLFRYRWHIDIPYSRYRSCY